MDPAIPCRCQLGPKRGNRYLARPVVQALASNRPNRVVTSIKSVASRCLYFRAKLGSCRARSAMAFAMPGRAARWDPDAPTIAPGRAVVTTRTPVDLVVLSLRQDRNGTLHNLLHLLHLNGIVFRDTTTKAGCAVPAADSAEADSAGESVRNGDAGARSRVQRIRPGTEGADPSRRSNALDSLFLGKRVVVHWFACRVQSVQDEHLAR